MQKSSWDTPKGPFDLEAILAYAAKIYTDDEDIPTRTREKIEMKELNIESIVRIDLKSNNGFAMQLVPVH